MSTLNLAVLAVLLVAVPTIAGAQVRIAPGSYCDRVGLSAAEASRLRLTGMSRETVQEELQKSFSEREVGMGVTAAFTYLDLRDFAMSDFVSNYCGIVTAMDGKLTDFDKLWIQTHYRRAVECATAGHSEKPAFLACWNEQARRAQERTNPKK